MLNEKGKLPTFTVVLGLIQIITVVVMVLLFFLKGNLNSAHSITLVTETKEDVVAVKKNVAKVSADVGIVCTEVANLQKGFELHDIRIASNEKNNEKLTTAIDNFAKVASSLDKSVAVLTEQVKSLKEKTK